jgi:hypothetical protein
LLTQWVSQGSATCRRASSHRVPGDHHLRQVARTRKEGGEEAGRSGNRRAEPEGDIFNWEKAFT